MERGGVHEARRRPVTAAAASSSLAGQRQRQGQKLLSRSAVSAAAAFPRPSSSARRLHTAHGRPQLQRGASVFDRLAASSTASSKLKLSHHGFHPDPEYSTERQATQFPRPARRLSVGYLDMPTKQAVPRDTKGYRAY
mmetsp:Transcript_14651/g.28708  ORF Transcript_14651/g.28708 Transcript_14651/m.28708 type:complete len:138 (-) Transcript_14651:97-510(-)